MLDNDYFLLRRIFEKAGLPLFAAGEKDLDLELSYRVNPDGSIRWVWPKEMRAPLFLKFYNVSTPRSRMIARVAKVLFGLGRFASGKIVFSVEAAAYRSFLVGAQGQWALFTGTTGAHRSALFYSHGTFFKIPIGEEASVLFTHEVQQLNRHRRRKYASFVVPGYEFEHGVLMQEDISPASTRSSELTALHWDTLAELAELNACHVSIGVLPEWRLLDEKLAKIQRYQDTRIPASMLRRLKELKDTIDSRTIIPASYAHGDFTPWNIYIREQKLGLIDWEMANPCSPLLYDAFHFIYQQSSLVDHLPYTQIEKQIEEAMQIDKARWIIDIHRLDVQLHHKLYLLFHIVNYLELYARQVSWHPQVKMNMEVWGQAIDALLIQEGKYTPRQALIAGLFDMLNEHPHAVLKWQGGAAVSLPETSDIDMAISPALRKRVSQYFKKNPLVARLKEHRKSFMSNFAVILQDGSFLSVDTIWTFKRRDIVMLDAKELLRSREKNTWGISVPSFSQDLNYTWLFYTLNGKTMPERYQRQFHLHAEGLIRTTNQEFPWTERLGVRDYREVFHPTQPWREKVVQTLLQEPANRGWNRWMNRFWYIIDTIREHAFKPGFIITFSGVDGAGKSTIIENLVVELEKKYRKKVVVLRHRPSLLPMLSAWTKGGRAAAETQAANTLPRQGTNRSTLSSLLRFAYYYTDYLLGQFVVNLRYVWRGYCVVYDRYYFDFINDSRRSNIHLPGGFIRMWYALLLKPRYNFFLYADEGTILQRKKELDGPTIRMLTEKYLTLFTRLGRKKGKARYIPIENKELPETLSVIRHSLQSTLL